MLDQNPGKVMTQSTGAGKFYSDAKFGLLEGLITMLD